MIPVSKTHLLAVIRIVCGICVVAVALAALEIVDAMDLTVVEAILHDHQVNNTLLQADVDWEGGHGD